MTGPQNVTASGARLSASPLADQHLGEVRGHWDLKDGGLQLCKGRALAFIMMLEKFSREGRTLLYAFKTNLPFEEDFKDKKWH